MLFGFGTSQDLATPIGQQIKTATDSLRISPDWAQYMSICDEIGSSKAKSEQAVKALRRRLQDNEQQTISLTLTLLETCMKNCGNVFAASFDKSLMDEVINITRGNKGLKNSDDALRLIQQWGRAYEDQRSYTIFFDTYMAMRTKGVTFPKEENPSFAAYEVSPQRSTSREVPISAPSASPAAQRKSISEPMPVMPPVSSIDPNEKLLADLGVVMEKVKLCREMLPSSPGIQYDEALSEVIGFLEACRDRMIDLVEAGSIGMLNEVVFEEVLKVNEALLKTLEAEKNGTPISVDEETNPSNTAKETTETPQKPVVTDNFFDFDNMKPVNPLPAISSVAGKSDTNDLLELDNVSPVVDSWSKIQLSKAEEELFGTSTASVNVSTSKPAPSVTEEEDFFAMLEKS